MVPFTCTIIYIEYNLGELNTVDFLGRDRIIEKTNYIDGSKYKEKTGFVLYHVVFTGTKRDNIAEDMLYTYDGNKACMLDFAINHGWTGRRFMDSGEFPAHKKGIRLDHKKYIDYVNLVGDQLDAIACMDYMPRESDGADYQRIAGEITWRDYCNQREGVRPELRDKFIYIIHGTDLAMQVERACAYRDSLGMPIKFLASSLADYGEEMRIERGAEYNYLLSKAGYDGQFHGLGLQVKKVIEGTPILTSCDSSSAVREQASGILFYKGQKIKIGLDTKHHHKGDFTDNQFTAIEPELRDRAKQLGINYDLARVNALERYLWNCKERSLFIQDLDPDAKPFIKRQGKGLLAALNKRV